MSELKIMQQNNSANCPSKIKELLMQISNTHFESDKISHKLEKNESRISELAKEVSMLKEEYCNENLNLTRKTEEASEYNFLLQNLIEDKNTACSTLRTLEKKYETMKLTKPSANDQQLLEQGKRKLKLFKEFTGIRWDYSAPETVIEGYLTNKKDYLQRFSYKSDVDYKILRDLIWKDIEKSIMKYVSRENYKENKAINNCIK